MGWIRLVLGSDMCVRVRGHLHEDAILAGLAGGVDFKVAQLGDLAFGSAFVLDALIAALAGRVGCHC